MSPTSGDGRVVPPQGNASDDTPGAGASVHRTVDPSTLRVPHRTTNIVVDAPANGTLRFHIGSHTGMEADHETEARTVEGQQHQQANALRRRWVPGTRGQVHAVALQRQPGRATHRRNIPLPPAGRGGRPRQQIRIVSTHGRSGTRIVPWHTTNAGSPLSGAIVPQLVPLPVPFGQQRHTPRPTNDTERDQYSRFKCPICFEILRGPIACASCNTHFCGPCIKRVVNGASHQSQKCPTCRAYMSLEDLRPNMDLQNEIRQAASVPCHYSGCNERLALPDIEQHEETCPFVTMKCRYAGFGCQWKGLRQDLAMHETACPLMRIAVLIEQFRASRARQEQAVAHLQQRVAASQSMMELQSGMIRRLHRRPMHAGEMFDLIYTAVCTPAQFLFTRDIWRLLHASREARGIVSNFCSLLPIGLVVAKNAARGFRATLELGDIGGDVVRDDALDLIDILLLSTLSSTLGALLLLSCFLDGKSPLDWTSYSPLSWFSRRIYRDVAVLASLSISVIAMELDGRRWRAFVVWMLTVFSTKWFPALLLTILEEANSVEHTSFTSVAFPGRAMSVVTTGLQCGLALATVGPMPCIDGAICLQLIIRLLPHDFGDAQADSSLSAMPTTWIVAYVIGRFSTVALPAQTGWANQISSLNLVAVVVSFLAHVLHLGCIWAGHQMGKRIAAAGRAQLTQPTGASRSCSILGMASFGMWISSLVAIAVSNT